METIRIVGPARLRGTAGLAGAKNAALPILVAAFAAEGPVTLENMPTGLEDVRVLMEIFRELGGVIEEPAPNVLRVVKTSLVSHEVPEELAGRIRHSLLMLGLLLARQGRVKLSMPGGCEIGDRKFDLHLMGLEALGARTRVTKTAIEAEAAALVGADIRLPIATTSGTENLMIAACFAKGVTRIFNAHTRPEIVDMANMLNALGADIRVSTRVDEVHGGRPLGSGTYRILPAWDEAATLMCAATMTGGELCVQNLDADAIQEYVLPIRQAGADVLSWGGHIFVKGPEKVRPIHIVTGPAPIINSDMHPIFAALCAVGDGESTITDTRFPERFAYVEEMRKMGAVIDHYENCAVVRGGRRLKGARVVARDLRCGAALAILALAAEGETVISNVYQLDRGYCRFEETLRGLGVQAERIDVADSS